jgi:phage shock protein PspC (stress-responsive transcriptional regulator)
VSGKQTFTMADVEHTAQDFWASRPRRPRKGRKIAGVAAGIANRYRIDPTLVRVALVVATIYGGAGLVVYLLGWLCLPEEDDAVSPIEGLFGRGRTSTSSAFTIVLCLAFIPVLSWFFSGFPGFLGLLVVVGLLMLLHRQRGNVTPRPAQPSTPAPSTPDPFAAGQPAPPYPYATQPYPYGPPPSPAAPSVPLPAPAAQATAPVAPETPEAPAEEPEPKADFPPVPPAPPAWDPLGAAPFAWDLPDPAPRDPEPEPPVRRRRSKVGLMTVGVTLIAVAGMAVLGVPETDMVGVALAVLGLGMVAGSFVRGGRGLIGLAVPLAVVGIGLTSVFPDEWPSTGITAGDIKEKPTSVSEVQPLYDRTAGSIKLDLSQLPDSSTVPVYTRVQVGAGSAKVIVPEDADVELTCRSGAGEVDCLGMTSEGHDEEPVTVTSEGSGDLKINVDVEVTGAGDVEVTRG